MPDKVNVPPELPVLPVRDTVLFPGGVMPLTVGRESSLALLNSLEGAASIPQIEFSAGDDARALVFRHLLPFSQADRDKLVAFGRENGFAILLQPGGTDSAHALFPENPRLHYHLEARHKGDRR